MLDQPLVKGASQQPLLKRRLTASYDEAQEAAGMRHGSCSGVSVSVAICLHNSLAYIDETLQSLQAQTWEDFEAMLVDDGSTDGTADYVARRYPDPRFTLIRQPNAGMGAARSACVSRCRGRYVAFLDHDDVWFPGKLERQMALARQIPEAAVIFSDCLLISSEGRVLGAMSEQYPYDEIDLRAGFAHDELLRRGCFVAMSTAVVNRQALKNCGLPDPLLKYGDDYDMWLRLSRSHPVGLVHEPLAKWRIHGASFTQKFPEISAGAHARIWQPIVENQTYPRALRIMVADHLLGQQKLAVRHLLEQRRPGAALRQCLEIFKRPGALTRQWKHRLSIAQPTSAIVAFLASAPGRIERLLLRLTRPVLPTAAFLWNLLLRITDFFRFLPNRVKRESWSHNRLSMLPGIHAWVDGTSLKSSQTGYFTFVCETIRSLARDSRFIVHVTVPRGGRCALCNRLGVDASRLQFHRTSLRPLRSEENHLQRQLQSLLRYFRRLVFLLRGQAVASAEILIWRGRFRFADSRKIAVIHDATAQLFPEFHTAANVVESNDFALYARGHADIIVTVSENSRRDIVEHLDYHPNSVRLVLSKIDPVYVHPNFDRRTVARHSLSAPYIFSVGWIEPRKNFRRLVEAFMLIQREGGLPGHVLAIAGPPGWDDGFDQFLRIMEAGQSVRRLGFVPVEDMPSLYHYADAFVFPSLYEGFGLPVLEAMCSSAVVLSSNAASLAEIAGSTVRTFHPRNAFSIAEAILAASAMSSEAGEAYRKECRQRGEELLQESRERPSINTLIAEELCGSCLSSRLST